MGNHLHKYSVFAHPDRGSFVAYFLGGVVPLLALGVLIERYVLSAVAVSDQFLAIGSFWVVCLFAAICFLSLSSFLMLRRLVNESLAKSQALAHYDPLTGLPNRRMFQERLEETLQRAQSRGSHVAVCFLDLDRFKRVNDTLGHNSGDGLLIQIAERLVGNVRLNDFVGRLDDDEPQLAVSRLGPRSPGSRIC